MRKYLLLLLIAGAVGFTACNSGSSKSNESNENVAVEEAPTAEELHAEFYVGGSCDMCTDRIENAVSAIEGVTLASYDLEKQELHLHYLDGVTSIDAISQALAAVGYDTDLHKADDTVYEALPGCCHYRK